MTTAPVIVIPCGKVKTPNEAPAADLYIGSSFRLARDAAQRDGRPWFILSALHGLVTPDQLLAPYDRRCVTRHDQLVLAATLQHQDAPPHVEAWTPRPYVLALQMIGVKVDTPLAGLGIGYRNQWWSEHAR